MPQEIPSEDLLKEFEADINEIKELIGKEGQNKSVKKVGEELIDCADKLIQQQKSNPASITEEDIKKTQEEFLKLEKTIKKEQAKLTAKEVGVGTVNVLNTFLKVIGKALSLVADMLKYISSGIEKGTGIVGDKLNQKKDSIKTRKEDLRKDDIKVHKIVGKWSDIVSKETPSSGRQK